MLIFSDTEEYICKQRLEENISDGHDSIFGESAGIKEKEHVYDYSTTAEGHEYAIPRHGGADVQG